MTTQTYSVTGMTCGHCAVAVADEIQAVGGVTDGPDTSSSSTILHQQPSYVLVSISRPLFLQERCDETWGLSIAVWLRWRL